MFKLIIMKDWQPCCNEKCLSIIFTQPGISHPNSWVRGRLSAARTEDARIRQEELSLADEAIRGDNQWSGPGGGTN